MLGVPLGGGAALSRRMEINFQLDGTPYVLEKVIGSGAYGAVGQALDTRTRTNVAIKKIARAFAALTLIKRTLREVRILREINHENIINILNMFSVEGCQGRDIYLVMDLMETDLHQIIHSTQKLTEQHNQYFLYQMLRGLKYLHSVGIVHRDMKPSNLLVNSNCLLKIADFGMARSVEQCTYEESIMTQYVSTRWYRAPELLFSLLDYDTKVDIWSVGCIFAEMIMRRQLFPGRDAAMQIKMIVCYLGTPEQDVMEKISAELVRVWIDKCGARQGLPWTTILPKATPKATDLIDKMMKVASWRRCTAEEALAHPYLDLYHDVENEPVGPSAIQFDADAIERLELNQLKDALLAEAYYFRGPSADGESDRLSHRAVDISPTGGGGEQASTSSTDNHYSSSNCHNGGDGYYQRHSQHHGQTHHQNGRNDDGEAIRTIRAQNDSSSNSGEPNTDNNYVSRANVDDDEVMTF